MMDTSLITTKKQNIRALRFSLELAEKELNEMKENSPEKPEFTKRNLDFSKDNAQAIVNKYKNPKYSIHKSEILSFITKKNERALKTKDKAVEICEIFKKFFDEQKAEQLEQPIISKSA